MTCQPKTTGLTARFPYCLSVSLSPCQAHHAGGGHTHLCIHTNTGSNTYLHKHGELAKTALPPAFPFLCVFSKHPSQLGKAIPTNSKSPPSPIPLG
ncbi:hypothetical protein LX32DRAFT_639435 [Colletotrichum zoysiae]|uniref:Uncharacterized protein n=1 Tax=Colletotrichum zoysiae TaxID=1216348 RepID=A0AAD9M1C4_9PEZI|nr:hypothetical protein LX32DRAFT_639435 [Colletotrichum zoysiae]